MGRYTGISDRLFFALSAAALSPRGPNLSARLRLAMCRRCFGRSFSGRLFNSFGSSNALRTSGRPSLIGFCYSSLLSIYGGLGQPRIALALDLDRRRDAVLIDKKMVNGPSTRTPVLDRD
jgi:hypothetical protein